ncbi:MAG: exodeoxyribonuclease III [bacterium]
MKIISRNVNGLRAVCRKDFLGWFKNTSPDILCLQELKLQKEQLPSQLLKPNGYQAFFSFAAKKGYSGVAVFSKKKSVRYEQKLGLTRFDGEGRILRLDFPGFSLVNLYIPHGGRQKENLKYKLQAYRVLINYLNKLKNKNIILIGDFNIAHTELDLARPKQNRNNIMFTPEERGQLDKIVELGFMDTFRMFHKEGGHYTWWPYFANARARNLGWRIDYCFTSKSLAQKVKETLIMPEVLGSDHCPVGIEL